MQDATARRTGPTQRRPGWWPRRFLRRGFTLVELLVVLAIGGLLLAVTPPLITAVMPGVEHKAAARRTAAGLRLAREIAVARGRDAAWILDVEQNRYSIEGDPRGGSLPGGLDVELVAAQEEMQTESVGAIRFYPDGSSSGGRVILKRGDTGYQVGVNWLTGRILIAEWEE
ncbi:MAG: prepilin-type N-terminal cleavage/methylation domain-containing protein [Gammaproteobacteria bacterium]|jgi:general secretion pathway protein H|nr:prepilin-type N-terminal cleavage/methylation domain-containing protein [Gammaproteobacteria bacterium]